MRDVSPDPSNEITHKILHNYQLIVLRVAGANSMSSLVDYLEQQLPRDAAFTPDLDYYVDAVTADATGAHPIAERAPLKQFAGDHNPRPNRPKWALVTNSDHVFGLIRMYSVELEDFFEFQVFRSHEEALTWLGRPISIMDELIDDSGHGGATICH